MGEFTDYLEHGQTIKESIHDKNLFKAVFIAGGSGSGKSFISDVMFQGMPIQFVNSDVAFEYLLKKEDLPFTLDKDKKEIYVKQMDTRQAAKKLTKERTLHWIDGMLPLVIDGTGKEYDKIKSQKEILEYTGYDTSMVFVNTTLEVATQRNKERERSIAPDEAKKNWEQAHKNIGKFQTLFGGEHFLIVDNSKPLTDDEIKTLKITLTRQAMKLINTPLQSKIGKAILAKIEEKKGLYLHDIAGAVDTGKLQTLKV